MEPMPKPKLITLVRAKFASQIVAGAVVPDADVAKFLDGVGVVACSFDAVPVAAAAAQVEVLVPGDADHDPGQDVFVMLREKAAGSAAPPVSLIACSQRHALRSISMCPPQ